MFGKINGMYLQGLDGLRIFIEADVSDGLPGYVFVGYLASEVRESQDRVRTAIRNLGLSLPPKKVTINLSPADIRKEGTGFDLAIAVAILMAHGLILPEITENTVFIGELGLDGKIKGVPGILALTAWAKEFGFTRIFLSKENLQEAAVIEGIGLVAVENLSEVLKMLQGNMPITEYQREAQVDMSRGMNCYDVDFSEVNGQTVLRRAAEVAAAGMHNLLMIGPAGSGKTMVARRIPTILPKLELEECIEISKIYSVSHLLSEQEPLIVKRPFRAPHHSISAQALAGGGSRPKPGEVSLATGGILFLDELPEMGNVALETLRQPLEERKITISRVHGTVCYPANAQLVSAMNPCKCGHFPNLEKCTCTSGQIKRYLSKVSRPLLDRIDICVEAAAVTYDEISRKGQNESSEEIRKRVEKARAIQSARFKEFSIRCNSEMSGKLVRKFCNINNEESQFMKAVFEEMELSARMYDKILKVARTTADLDGREEIAHRDLCEAISYVRVRDKYWKN
ncbi:MAG: YifB family Mg chelatase-like AAA ATPase [Lachnospiraceae bacterium]|nr:YifB family Mg chelatase-like AAA ATPase [Lachnospiraceae bacterium]